MSEKIDKFCENLHTQLSDAEAKLNQVKSNIGAAKADTQSKIDSKIAEAKASADKTKKDINAAKAKLKSDFENKKAETDATIAEWKKQRQVKKLENRAEDAEAYAAWSILVAQDAIEEANVASLEAIGARLDADEAASS